MTLNIVPQPNITLYYKVRALSLEMADLNFQQNVLRGLTWVVAYNNSGVPVNIRVADIYAYSFKEAEQD